MGYIRERNSIFAVAVEPKRGDAYRKLAKRLRDARIEAGLTQAEAADRLGKPQSFISKCESGERRLDVLELKALARIYGKDFAYFGF